MRSEGYAIAGHFEDGQVGSGQVWETLYQSGKAVLAKYKLPASLDIIAQSLKSQQNINTIMMLQQFMAF